MPARLPKHLDDAIDAAEAAMRFVGKRDATAYERDALRRSAVERQLEIVGEACRRALADDPTLADRVPDAGRAVALRNRLAHGYDSVSHLIVHDVVTTNLPRLIEALRGELARIGRA